MKRKITVAFFILHFSSILYADTVETLSVESPTVPASVLTKAKSDQSSHARVVTNDSEGSSTTPQKLQIIPGVNEIIPVAIGHLNRIVTPFSKPEIRTVSTASTSISGNVVYVSPPDETPVTLFITPESSEDLAISITLIPKRIPPREIQLSLNDTNYKKLESVQHPSSEGGDQPSQNPQEYIAELKFTFRSLALMRTPAGYALRDPLPNEQLQCIQSNFHAQTGQTLEGKDLYILVGVLQNKGPTTVEVDERACTGNNANVLAVSVWPQVMLGPGESTELYVAVRKPSEVDGSTTRPSLLTGEIK
jgi:conjugal transfer pilus assembly protein TraK